MGTERAANCGVDNIITAWEGMNDGYPYLSVWFNKNDKAFQWNKDDIDGAEDYLRANLEMMEKSGETALYYLRIHPDKEAVYRQGSPILCTIPIRPNPLVNSQINGTGMYANGGDYFTMMRENMQLKFENEKLKEADDDDGMHPVLKQITGILDSPHFAPVIGQVLSTLVDRFLPAASQNSAMLAGVDDVASIAEMRDAAGNLNPQTQEHWARINAALVRLSPHLNLAVGLEKLAEMAEQKPDYFKMLVNML